MTNTELNKKNLERPRSYLQKDYDRFVADLERYARTYYGDKIQDFSINSLMGLLLRLPAAIGDNLSFYLDHAFHELDYETAIEPNNLRRIFAKAQLNIGGVAPAVTYLTVSISVPYDTASFVRMPKYSLLPMMEAGSTFSAENGIVFESLERLDFAEQVDSVYITPYVVDKVDNTGLPLSYRFTKTIKCVSGTRVVENISINSQFIAYREITLANANITEIIKVSDAEGNEYFEVEALSQNIVFKKVDNQTSDSNIAASHMELIPAPYRYVKIVDPFNKTTTLRFGGSPTSSLKESVIPDPTDIALPLYNKSALSRISIAPSNLLQSDTLGVSPTNTTISVDYRYGGGKNHNIRAKGINKGLSIKYLFPLDVSLKDIEKIKNSLSVSNANASENGVDALTIDELRTFVPLANMSQSRLASAPDVLLRAYTMPSTFGRVYRASLLPHPTNPLNTQLFVAGLDSDNHLSLCSDTTKQNVSKYLNEFRFTSRSIDILDARILNLRLNFVVGVDASSQKEKVLAQVLQSLRTYFNISNFQIDQPIMVEEVRNIIYNTNGVSSVPLLQFQNLVNSFEGRNYSDSFFDVKANQKRGILYPTPNSIFEIKYPLYDIVGKAE